jgi:hypothetical protein
VLPVIAAVIAAACVAASLRRLLLALAPTRLDLVSLHAALRGDAGRRRLGTLAAVLERAGSTWEQSLFEAAQRDSPAEERIVLYNEELAELDWRVQRWARVPRVCASIATSSGLLLATVALRDGLLVSVDLPAEVRDLAIHQALIHAVDVVAMGLAGAVFCIAIQVRARKAARDRAEAADKLVERLEALASASPPPKLVYR